MSLVPNDRWNFGLSTDIGTLEDVQTGADSFYVIRKGEAAPFARRLLERSRFGARERLGALLP